MDSPEGAAALADSQVADAVNQEWLLASARSSQLSTELRHYQLDWSADSGHSYGAADTAAHLGSRQRQPAGAGAGCSSAPPGLARQSWWRRRRSRAHSASSRRVVGLPVKPGGAYGINGHLYDNISYADTPLLRSITSKRAAGESARDEPCGGRFRILLACLVLLGITLANYSRNALSLAAVGMVASNVLNRELVELLASEPALGLGEANASASAPLPTALDGSCPLGRRPAAELAPDGAKRRAQLEMQSRASVERRVASGELVDWTPGEQGLISAAGSLGNLLIAVPLTRLGELYGPKWIVFGASLGATIQAALMPLVASRSVPLVLLFQLIFNGLTYGADCVAYTLFAHWLTATEMAFFVSCLIICYQLGAMLSSIVTAKLLALGAAWSWCFYTPAILCAVWTLVWSLVGASEPLSSGLVSRAELLYLMRNSKISQTLAGSERAPATRSQPVSWSKLARDPNIWAIIAVKFTLRWYFSAYLSLMPTYLSSVGHMSVATIGQMSLFQSFVGLFSGLAMGYLTKSLVERRLFGLSLAATRKCFQSVVNFGLALSLALFIAYDCNQWVTIVSLTFGGFCISFYVAAALQIPLDLSPSHCGLITSITNTLALGQALGAPVSGLILNAGPKERSRWRIVWGVAIAMNTLSGLIFILLVDSRPRDYNRDAPSETSGALVAGDEQENSPVAPSKSQQVETAA